MKYICKNNPAHTFSEPTADFWCPLCEKNTGMLELVDTPKEDQKLKDLNKEINSIKKEISGLNDSLKESTVKSNESKEDLVDEIKDLKKELERVKKENLEKENIVKHKEAQVNTESKTIKDFLNQLLETNTVDFTNKLFESITTRIRHKIDLYFKKNTSSSENTTYDNLGKQKNKLGDLLSIALRFVRKIKIHKFFLLVSKVITIILFLFVKIVAF